MVGWVLEQYEMIKEKKQMWYIQEGEGTKNVVFILKDNINVVST